MRVLLAFCVVLCIAGIHSAHGRPLRSLLELVCQPGTDLEALREKVATYSVDARMSLVDLYRAQCGLRRSTGWVLEEVFREQLTLANGERLALPASCLRTLRKGPALWLLTGIHGEEPAGPDALAERLMSLTVLERKGVPLVVMPLLNPLGYQRNWRYPDASGYSEQNLGSSVGDSDHLLPGDSGKPRRASAISLQAQMLTTRVAELARDYPPLLVLDLHEDNLLKEGYLYSQGVAGADDRVAAAIIGLCRDHAFPILMVGTTRFGETVSQGVVSGVKDGSIDELLSATAIILHGSPRKGPSGHSVLVLETSSMNTALPDRKRVHGTILDSLGDLWALAQKLP